MIVEFIEGRDFMTAWVTGTDRHRLAVLGQDGRDMTVAAGRVLNSQDMADPGTKAGRLEILRAVAETRKRLAREVDLGELWDILAGEGDLFPFADLAGLYFGRAAGADDVSAVTRAVFADGVRFRFSPEGAVRHSAEEADRVREKTRRQAEAERRLEAMAGWVAASLAQGGPAPEPPEGAQAREILLGLALKGDKSPTRATAATLLTKAGLAADEKGAAEALTAVGEFSKHENLDLRRLEIPLTFEPPALAEAAGLRALTAAQKAGRLDLTAMRTLTLDSNGARDMDDAISVKSLAGGRYQVGIHITDVAAFIPQGSPLDMEARARACSIYLPEGKYPMLPAVLSEGLFSLTPGDVKPAFSFLATIERDGAISECSAASSLVRVDRQLSFSEADQIFDDDSDMVDLWDMAQALMGRRQAEGGSNLNIPKLNVYFQADGALSIGVTQWDTPSRMIVSELMILANYLAAKILLDKGYPCPFRYQEKPRAPEQPGEEPAPGDTDDLRLAKSLAARRRVGRGGLTFTPSPHHGLGLAVYTSFTAPMRRYLDLLVARQLKAAASGRPPALGEQEFMKLALPAFDLTTRIQKMQNNRQRYWLLTEMAGQIGREYDALVFEQRDRRLRVCLTDYMLEADVFLPRSAASPAPRLFGQRLRLRLLSVDPGEFPPARFEVET